MPNPFRLAQLQHAMQYPSGHLDRFASFGPAFEMDDHIGTPTGNSNHPDADRSARINSVSDDDETIGAIMGNSRDIRRFITGGKAIFTIVGKTNRYTFRVTRKDPEGQYTQPAYFLGLLTGPDNVNDYTYVGMVDVEHGSIRLTRKSVYRTDSAPVVALNWLLGVVWSGRELPPACQFWHVGRCARCGRALTVPASIASGFGPECLAKMEGGE